MPRLDALVTKAGLAPSRERAQALILAGKVKVDGETVRKPDRAVAEGTPIAVDADQEYASRGALKLGPALDRFGVDVTGRVCADIGASTGGFTDVLLRRGAGVVVIERVNARNLESFPEPVSLVVIDVSFIGLEKVLPAITAAAPRAEVVALFKPQFQVERPQVGKGGIVRDLDAVEGALRRFRDWCAANSLRVLGEAPSELAGADGNREIFIHIAGPAR
ncbi:MAG: TlyA family RNA methyltransferase [Chloroflexi bacterium]|nr:MAG: TlyA family RNA methyltransferase [Chloroflexota bacterium]